MDCSPPGSSVLGDSPGQNIGVGCHVLLQGIFPTQGSKPGLPHCRWTLYHLSHKGSPRIMEWIAYPFSSDLPCIAGIVFTSWATINNTYNSIIKRQLTKWKNGQRIWMNISPKKIYRCPLRTWKDAQGHWSSVQFSSVQLIIRVSLWPHGL